MTKFAIIIPTYKRPDGKSPFYVNRALNSILNQVYKNYKVFLIGDRYDGQDEFDLFGEGFSSENFYKENLPKALERDEYKNKEILWKYGGCKATNYGIDLALQENIDYVCMLDHDDKWNPNHLKNFNELIETHNPPWMCSSSTYLKGTLPNLKTSDKFVTFTPTPATLVKSSACINYKVIPIRIRNVYEETGKVGRCADSDLWERISKYMKENELKGYLVNEVTCYHDEEGYSLRNEI
jgi:glycosyltransferase involved in cell wall biosynthesis